MKASVPIKSDIFRFITLRTPDHLSQDAKHIHFLYHPDISKSKIALCPGEPPAGDDKDTAFKAYLQSFHPVKHYLDIRAINPALYDFSDVLMKRPSQLGTYSTNQTRDMLLNDGKVINLFDQLFYQVIVRESNYVRQACVQMLIANHCLTSNLLANNNGSKQAPKVMIVIPKELLRCFKPWIYRHCEGELNQVNRLGIADFRRVEQELCCYVPGEVSHIENVLAREYKERSTRNLMRSEVTLETTREVEMEKLTDVTTTTRNELHTEIASVLTDDRTTNYGGSAGVSGTLFGAQFHADAFATFATANSSTYSNTSAQLYAQEVTKRALERILQRTTEKRTSKIIKEFEENNKHGFDNRNGDQHVTGIYRWVDVIYKNRLVNYGKRLMYEFMVPEPATFFKRVQDYKPKTSPNPTEPSPTTGQVKPKTLSENGVNSAADITRANYSTLANKYGITIAPPSEETKTASQAFSPTPPITHNDTAWTQTFNIPVEPRYEAVSASGSYTFEYKSNWPSPTAYFNYNIGGIIGGKSNLRSGQRVADGGGLSGNFGNHHSNQVPVVFQGRKLYTYAANLVVICKLKPAEFAAWQVTAYSQLQQAYQSLQSQYEASIEHANTEGDVTFDSPESDAQRMTTAMKRIIEQRELKRACMEMLTRPFCRVQGNKLYQDMNACDLYDVPKIKLTKELGWYSEQVKFLEQAFEWSLMSYTFYPYYWADRCDWAALMQATDDDLIFQAFKQAGMARVVAPVRPEFEEAVAYYLETGDIWLGRGLVVETEDDFYLSVMEDMQSPQGIVEGEWETRVPTTLAIVQDKSAKLDQEGLPCCDVVVDAATGNDITTSNAVLQIIHP